MFVSLYYIYMSSALRISQGVSIYLRVECVLFINKSLLNVSFVHLYGSILALDIALLKVKIVKM